jgi:hypothetical protein
MALDPDTMKHLEDVKRGKIRRFVMIAKGEKILTLIVYKKGSIEKYKKEAKEDHGAGQFYHGVVDGKGMNIVFKLCTADGFTEPPGKDIKMKMFLSDETGIKFKPTYEIVAELPEIPEIEDESGAVETEEAKSEEVTLADPEQAAKAIEALNKLTPLIKLALIAAPERKLEILQPAATIKDLIAKGDLSPARKQLLDYATLLKQIGTATGSTPKEDLLSVWRTAKESVDSQLRKFRDALKNTGDPYLTKVGSGGLEMFVNGPGREFVNLQAALFEVQGATGPAKQQAGKKLLTAVKTYKQYVSANKFIEVCDANKLCGPLSVGKTLGDALSKLEVSVGNLVA